MKVVALNGKDLPETLFDDIKVNSDPFTASSPSL